MSKRTPAIIALAFALLGTACLCLPGGLLPFVGGTQQLPSAQASTAAAEPTLAEEQIPACVLRLDQTLYEAENGSSSGAQLTNEFPLVTYSVEGDAIIRPEYPPVPGQVAEYQQDVAGQQEIWRFVTDVIPADQRTWIIHFEVYTDGVGGSLGAVEQTDDPHYWRLQVDLIDAGSFADLSTTLIHELGHLLTLNDSQVTTDQRVFLNPDDERVYQQAEAACSTYFVFEGCSRPDSYLNLFFSRFWTDIYDEWLAVDQEEDRRVYEERLDAFYQAYALQFVSSYAATSPTEDIAESFMYFIFSPRPSGETIADQKVLFFYEYPEMVDLRQRILEHLCTYLD